MSDGAGAASIVRLVAGDVVASVLSYGATLVGFEAPDRVGEVTNCVVTLADPADLADPALNPHLGGIVGRYANRIANARFGLDGVTHYLEANEGANMLHGGSNAWDRRRWSIVTAEADATAARVTLALSDPDGEGGFPGRVDAVATYSLRMDRTLTLEVACTTDRPTVVAPTNHVYWNLAGSGTIDDHRLTLAPDLVLELGPGQVPTGTALSVADGPWNFRNGARLGDRLGRPELGELGGYDHTFLMRTETDGEPDLALAARLIDPKSGRTLEMRTDQPAVHLYTGNHLGGQPGQHGPILRHGGVCLEAGQVPDGPNLATIAGPEGPIGIDVTLRPGDVNRWLTSWKLIDGT